MLSRRALLLPTAVAALALAGCSVGDDGPQTTQTRDVNAFTRIDNEDSVDVQVRVGEPQRVRVIAGEKVIDGVRTVVRDGTLKVTFDGDGVFGDEVRIEASTPRLTEVTTSGSGDVDVAGIAADAFAARSDGSGDLDVAGRAARLALDLDGSGDADAARLDAREARVFTGGSGDVEVRAGERLEVTVDGSGDVRYHGDPALTEHVDGSGELSRAN